MNRLDELNDLLESRGDAADGLHPDLGDVRSRARRQRHSTMVVGAVASIAAIGGITAAVVAGTGGGTDDGQRVGTADTAEQPTTTVPTDLPPFQRVLSDGHVVRAKQYGAATYFGPFGDDHEWSAGADCAAGIQLDLDQPPTGPNGQGGGGGGTVLQSERALVEALTWSYDTSSMNTYIPALVAVVPDAQPGSSYRLVVDGEAVDTARADSALLVLAGPGPEQEKTEWGQQQSLPIEERDPNLRPEAPSTLPSVDASLQRLDDQGSVVEEQSLPLGIPYDPPARCTTPPEPSGLGPASPADSQDPDDVAISGIIATLMPTNGNSSAALPHVDDPDGSLAGRGGSGVPNNMATVAREIHRDSPSHAWAKWGFQLGGGEITPETPDVFVGWVELNLRDGQWLMTLESYCAFSSGPTGQKCPGTPAYHPISATGSPGIFIAGD